MLTREDEIAHERSAWKLRVVGLFGCSNYQPITIDREESQLLPTPRRMTGKVDRGYESSRTIPTNKAGVSKHLVEQRCLRGVICCVLPIWRRKKEHDPASRLKHHAPIRVWAEWFEAFSGITERISE